MTSTVNILLTLYFEDVKDAEKTYKNIIENYSGVDTLKREGKQLDISLYETVPTSFSNDAIYTEIESHIIGVIEEGYIDLYEHCGSKVVHEI